MRTTGRRTQATRVLTERAAGAAGGKSRHDHGGRGSDHRVITPGRSRCALVPGRPLRPRRGRGREARQRGAACPASCSRTLCLLDIALPYVPEFDLSPADAVSAN